MTRRPWFKFYSGDWRADPGLRACTFAARGLWIDLLTIMHEARPYGHLLINGKPPTYYRIAQVLGTSPHVVKRLMAQLKSNDVFSVTSRGEVYSRRMVRDKLKSEQGQKFSELRWGAGPIAPETRKKERGPTEESKGSIIDPNPRRVGRIKAQHRIERDLLQQLGEEGYARAIEALAANPKLIDRATEAERRSPGSGVMAAMLGLRQKA